MKYISRVLNLYENIFINQYKKTKANKNGSRHKKAICRNIIENRQHEKY